MSSTSFFGKINFSNLGNLVLGVSGAIAVFCGAMGLVKEAAAIVAIGIMGKAICSAINEYQNPSATPVVTPVATPVVAVDAQKVA